MSKRSPITCSLPLATLAFLAGHSAHANTATQYNPGYDPGMGFNLVSWANFGSSGATVWENAVQEVYDAGFDEVSLSPVRFFNPNTGSIATSSSQGAELSHVAAGVVRAKQLGMKVTVNPFVEYQNFQTWRGFWNPAAGSAVSNTYWSDYRQYIADAAAMAEANGADAFNVGTEMQALTNNSGHNGSWTSVINAADAAFSGEIGYASNWSEYNNPNIDNAIWSNPAIDYLGVDAYFPIVTERQANSSGTNPNPAFIDLVEANWNDLLDNEILPYAHSQQGGEGLPVKFTEYGLLPFNRATVQHGAVQNGTVDTDEQIMGFDGLLRALDGRQADGDILAMHIWQWSMPGSNGSLWNMDPSLPANQPNNVAATQWLSAFVSNPADLLLGDYNGDGFVSQSDLDLVLLNWGVDVGVGGVPAGWTNLQPTGVISQSELDLVLLNWGDGGAAAAALIPEPSAMALLLSFALPSVLRRRHAVDA